jgi:hypothetical protein
VEEQEERFPFLKDAPLEGGEQAPRTIIMPCCSGTLYQFASHREIHKSGFFLIQPLPTRRSDMPSADSRHPRMLAW